MPDPPQSGSTEPAEVVWTPKSAGTSPTVERKEFRPVNFESPTLPRKNLPKPEVIFILKPHRHEPMSYNINIYNEIYSSNIELKKTFENTYFYHNFKQLYIFKT